MNREVKWHKPESPAFAVGEVWYSVSGNIQATVIGTYRWGSDKWDCDVYYRFRDGSVAKKDCWNFQVRYQHSADFPAQGKSPKK